MYACFDIGGTEIKSAAISDKLILNDYAINKSKNDIDYIVDLIVRIVKGYEEKYNIKGVCISAPGAVEKNSGVIYGVSALSCIHGFSWKDKLGNILGLKISIENDANCVALCELKYGHGKEHNDFLSLVIGTGVGASIVKDKKIHRGANLLGGEFGFMITNQKDKSYQTFNDYASVGSMVRRVRSLIGDEFIDGKQIFEMSEKGNKICTEAVDEFYRNLAVGIYNMKFIYDPEIIVLGGAVSQQYNFIERINENLVSIMKEITYNTFHKDIDIQRFLPKLKTCLFSKDANLYGAMANYIIEHEK